MMKDDIVRRWDEDKTKRARNGVHYVSDEVHQTGTLTINCFPGSTMALRGYFAFDENGRQFWASQGIKGNLEDGLAYAELLFKRCTVMYEGEELEWFRW